MLNFHKLPTVTLPDSFLFINIPKTCKESRGIVWSMMAFLGEMIKTKFTSEPDWNRSEPNWTGSASVYMWPFGTDQAVYMEPIRNGSKTGPGNQQVQCWIRLDLFQTGSRTVPCKQKVDPIQFSDPIHLEFVWDRSRVNIA